MLKPALIIVTLIFAVETSAQMVSTVKYNDLESLVNKNQEELIIINFWASWCGPCIKEMPYFDALDHREDIKVVFVSLDFQDELNKVIKLVEKKAIASQVLWLDETDYDYYMRQVSEEWSGAIPATLMVDRDERRYFFERAFTADELNTTVNKILNNID